MSKKKKARKTLLETGLVIVKEQTYFSGPLFALVLDIVIARLRAHFLF